MKEDSDQPVYSIGEVADKAGVSRRTVRYYVQRRLLAAPVGRGRGSGYTDAHLEQIVRILRLQREGLSLDSMQQLPDAPPLRDALPPADARPSLVMRVPVSNGIQLELDVARGTPSAEVLKELAEACLRILEKK